MKKIILLISICLLSQNYTIANENGEPHYNNTSLSEQTTNSENILRAQNSYSSSLIAKTEEPAEQNKSLKKSDLKFPGLKLPETNDSVQEEQIKAEQQETKEEKINTEDLKTTAEQTSSIKVKEISNKELKEDEKTEIIQESKEQEENPFKRKYADPPKKEQDNGLNKSDLKFPGLKLPETNDSVQEESIKAVKELQNTEQENVKNVDNQSNTEKQTVGEENEQPEPQVKETEQNQQEPLDAMSILRSQTTTPIHQTQKIKPLPKNIAQKYKLHKNSITIEKNNNETNQQKANQEIKIAIKRVEFPESAVFTQEELQNLAAPLLAGPATIEDIKKVVSDITRCYTLGDYPTAKAYLPPQKITDGTLRIELLEGTIGKIQVEDNRWVRTSYIKKRIANKKEGELLNINDLEKDITRFNNNNSAKVKASLSPGENPGESDITLKVSEPSPFRISVISDNMGRKAIGTGRFGSMINTDSLFGVSDKLTLGGYLGRGNRIGFTDYNIPVGKYGTRIGVSAAAGNISVVNGIMRQFGVGGTSQTYSLYITQPIYDAEDASISSYTAANFKKSTSDIMDFKFYNKSTFSLTQGFNAKKDTTRGIWYTGHYGSVGFKALNGDENFFKYEGNVTRLHDFGKGIIGQFRVSGQYSPDNNLPWMEQFQIGGMSTVRGYSEALLLGKSGYFASAEIITPIPILPKRIGSDKLGYIYPREMIKGAVFMDNGMIFPYKYGESIDSGELLMSWGFGLRVNIKDDLAARFYWGYGLHNRYEADYKMGRFHFDLTCSPDVSKLVSSRKPSSKSKSKKKNKKEKQVEENL